MKRNRRTSRLRGGALVLTILGLIGAGPAAAAAPKFQGAYTISYTTYRCEIADASTCTQTQRVDAATGTIDVEGSIISPDGGTSSGQGYQVVGGRLGRTIRVKQDPKTITATAKFHILPGTEVAVPGPFSYANNGIGVSIYGRNGTAVCNVSDALYVTQSGLGGATYQGPADLEVTVTATNCKDGDTVVPLKRGSYNVVAYLWANEWLGCRGDLCMQDTGKVRTRIVAQVTDLTVTTT